VEPAGAIAGDGGSVESLGNLGYGEFNQFGVNPECGEFEENLPVWELGQESSGGSGVVGSLADGRGQLEEGGNTVRRCGEFYQLGVNPGCGEFWQFGSSSSRGQFSSPGCGEFGEGFLGVWRI